jgi:hypothetical protein
VRYGQFHFTPQGPKQTTVAYAVALAGGRGLRVVAAVLLVTGLAALIAGVVLLQTLVVSHPVPAVRGQSFQMIQAVHFLWPPFLIAGLYRMGTRNIRTALDGLAHNLPHMKT